MPNFNKSRGYKMNLKGFTTEVPGDTKNEIKIKTDSSKYMECTWKDMNLQCRKEIKTNLLWRCVVVVRKSATVKWDLN